jgi:hypothetical protein
VEAEPARRRARRLTDRDLGAGVLARGRRAHRGAELAPGTSFQYTVVAQWGGYFSGPSPAADGTAVAAPLNSSVPVHVDTTASPGPGWGPIVVGYQWDDTWNAMPSCTPGSCTMRVLISIAPDRSGEYTPFPVALSPSGAGYSGTAETHITGCRIAGQVFPETDTVTLTLAPVNGKVQNGAWTAWAGTMEMSAPYLNEDNEYCPAANWTFAVTSRLSCQEQASAAPEPTFT